MPEERDLQNFLTHLAVEKRVSPSTPDQALDAAVFFYRNVVEEDIEGGKPEKAPAGSACQERGPEDI